MVCITAEVIEKDFDFSDQIRKLKGRDLNNLLNDAEAKLKQLKEQAAFNDFSDTIIGYANTTFSPLYARVFKRYWDNEFYARMKHSFFYSNFDFGLFEFYVPTFASPELNMKYSRIAIKVVPELDDEIYANAIEELRTRRVSDPRTFNRGGPPGQVTSESLFVVGRKLSAKFLKLYLADKERSKKGLKKKMDWYLRAKKLTPPEAVPNVRAMPIIAREPERVMKRLLEIVMGFFDESTRKMCESFHLNVQRIRKPYRTQFKVSTTYYRTFYSTCSLHLEEIGLSSLANGVLCLAETLDWLCQKRAEIIAEMARQSNVMRAIAKIDPIKPLIRELEQLSSSENPFNMEERTPILEAFQTLMNLKPRG